MVRISRNGAKFSKEIFREEIRLGIDIRIGSSITD